MIPICREARNYWFGLCGAAQDDYERIGGPGHDYYSWLMAYQDHRADCPECAKLMAEHFAAEEIHDTRRRAMIAKEAQEVRW